MAGLLSSRHAKEWLENFAAGQDRDTAAKLAGSITVFSESDFYAFLQTAVSQFAASGSPIALFPISGGVKNIAFESDALPALTGSELIVLNVLNKYAVKDRVLISPSLGEMKNAKVRQIVLFTDFVGSGTEAIEFLEFMCRNSTIRSWHSLKYITFTIATFAIGNRGLRAIQWDRRRPALRWEHAGLDFDSMGWDTSTRAQIEDLCRRYADRPHLALGFGDSAALLAFPHTFPNNAPRIFLQPRGRNDSAWSPFLLGSRSIGLEPPQWLKAITHRPEFDPEAYLDSLAEGNQARKLRRYERRALGPHASALESGLPSLLVSVSVGHTEDHELAQSTRMSFTRLEEVLNLAVSLDLVDPRRALTKRGRSYLKAASRRAKRARPRGAREVDGMYYPRSLR